MHFRYCRSLLATLLLMGAPIIMYATGDTQPADERDRHEVLVRDLEVLIRRCMFDFIEEATYLTPTVAAPECIEKISNRLIDEYDLTDVVKNDIIQFDHASFIYVHEGRDEGTCRTIKHFNATSKMTTHVSCNSDKKETFSQGDACKQINRSCPARVSDHSKTVRVSFALRDSELSILFRRSADGLYSPEWVDLEFDYTNSENVTIRVDL